MKNNLTIIFVMILFVATTGCGKKKASFTTDKSVYKQGETIRVTNTTEKPSKYYKWSFGGVEIIDENPVYTLPEDAPVGSFEISCLPTNNKGTTENPKRTTQTVMVEEADNGSAIFYINDPVTGSSSETATVTMNGLTRIASQTFVSSPNCDGSTNGTASFKNLKKGTYNYVIDGSSSFGSYHIESAVEITNGFDCKTVRIQ